MPVNVRFNVSSDLGWRDVFATFLSEYGLALRDEGTKSVYSGDVTCPGFIAVCGAVNGSDDEAVDILQIKPATVFVSCALIDPDMDFDDRLSSALRGMIAVLRRVPGDASILMEYNRAVLVRRNGRLVLDSRFDTWNSMFPERLVLLENIPFTKEVLPVL